MRIGFVVDGRSEFASLPNLFPALANATGHELIKPVLAKVTPTAPIGAIVHALAEEVTRLKPRRLDLIVILIDREQRPECPGILAQEIAAALAHRQNWAFRIAVVIKDTMYENWLVADPEALKRQRARFTVSRRTEQSVAPNKADRVSAYELLRSCARDRHYDKVKDSVRILQHADPARMAANSRSFRRFLRCLDHPDYRDQSQLPRPIRES